MKSWIKGGWIGVMLSVVYFVIGFFIVGGINNVPLFNFFTLLARPISFKWLGLEEGAAGLYIISSLVSILITAFILGAIISLIVGKLRK